MLNVVLCQPEIPSNTGNVGRTCVLTGARLHLVEPLGFSLDDAMLRRAGLGYWESLDVSLHASWQAFLSDEGLDREGGPSRLHLLTKKARRRYVDATYRDGDYLVLGCESSGLPEGLLASLPDRCERIPMLRDEQSLENRASWAAREEALRGGHGRGAGGSPLRRQDVCGNFVDPDDWRISALNLSNAAAVTLYEALRQTGFPGME